MKLPETNRCCFYCPLRWGIILFGYLNMISSLLAACCLAMTIEVHHRPVNAWDTQETTGAFLFAVFGMSVILSILLIFAAYEKDKAMLRLYNSYAMATTLAAVVPTGMLAYVEEYKSALVAMFGIIMQCYVYILVRSEVLKLEENSRRKGVDLAEDGTVDIPDSEILVV